MGATAVGVYASTCVVWPIVVVAGERTRAVARDRTAKGCRNARDQARTSRRSVQRSPMHGRSTRHAE